MKEHTLPPLVHAQLVHAQLETIHPFDNRNGRTARALAYVILRRHGVDPHFLPLISVMLARDRDGYSDGLTQFRGDGVVQWTE